MSARPLIALLTDFGWDDWFVGSMKAAILARLPECAIVDLCHAIEPGAVAQGAWLLAHTIRDYPEGTVFCAVVDPGVGTARRAVAAAAGQQFFVAPDNGLLWAVLLTAASGQCRAIVNPNWMRPSPSRTFHGRDIFAPAAAQIARCRRIEEAGPIVNDPVRIDRPTMRVISDGAIEGEVVYFDRFGNAVTTIERKETEADVPPEPWRVSAKGLTIGPISSTYADVRRGEAVAYWGSLDTLEIAVRQGNARRQLGLALGVGVRLERSQNTSLQS